MSLKTDKRLPYRNTNWIWKILKSFAKTFIENEPELPD